MGPSVYFGKLGMDLNRLSINEYDKDAPKVLYNKSKIIVVDINDLVQKRIASEIPLDNE